VRLAIDLKEERAISKSRWVSQVLWIGGKSGSCGFSFSAANLFSGSSQGRSQDRQSRGAGEGNICIRGAGQANCSKTHPIITSKLAINPCCSKSWGGPRPLLVPPSSATGSSSCLPAGVSPSSLPPSDF
jgi:hypothetical protein